MSKTYFEEETYNGTDFSAAPFPAGDYDNCAFINCVFTSADLSGVNFSECRFDGCDMSLATLTKTTFNNAKFKDCKMLGLHFNGCNKFLLSLSFENCMLNLSSFYKLNLKKTLFKNCSLHEVDFSEADLSASVFDRCDFFNATFDNTVLEKADFRTSYHYTINPEINRVKKAKFSADGLIGLLVKYDIVVG